MSEQPKCKHHWHEIGFGTTRGMGDSGDEAVRCCHCGVDGWRSWWTVRRPVEGCGAHFTESCRVHGEVVISHPHRIAFGRIVPGTAPPESAVSNVEAQTHG